MPPGVSEGSMVHNHSHCIETALESATKICADRGRRLTDIRRRVLELVWQSHKAVKAYDILDQLGDGVGSAKPPTVYRALDFLIAEGLVHKIESLNAFVGCPHPHDTHQGQFMICSGCETVTEIESDTLSSELKALAASVGFQVNAHTIELTGLCSVCSARRQDR